MRFAVAIGDVKIAARVFDLRDPAAAAAINVRRLEIAVGGSSRSQTPQCQRCGPCMCGM
jgi:hypothetical protein